MNELFFYAVTNPDDTLSQQIIDKNRRDLDFWRNQLPDDDADLATTILRINLRTGLPRKFIAASLFTVRFLRDLPAVRTLVDKLGHLDLPRLNTITRALAKVPSRFLTLFDEHVASYLTPTRQHQVLPQPGSIAAMLRRLRERLLPEEKKPPGERPAGVFFHCRPDGVRVSVSVSQDHAALLNTAINTLVRERGLAPVDAFTALVLGSIRAEVTMHAYGTQDTPEFLADGGWLSPEQIEFWKTKVTSQRDMDPIAFAETPDYTPTLEMKMYVRGRDATCRVPGCGVAAVHCQIDHILPFNQGGPTTPWNLQCLCIFHHNMKTDGRLEAVPLPDGDVLFVLDGLPFRSTPEGPLSRSGRTWGTTFGDYMDRKVAA